MHRINLYQTLLTEGQWSYINKVFFENDCRKRKYSLRSLFEAVLYLLMTGCQWRMLPHDYPNGNWYITISANGFAKDVLNICSASLCAKSTKSDENRKKEQILRLLLSAQKFLTDSNNCQTTCSALPKFIFIGRMKDHVE